MPAPFARAFAGGRAAPLATCAHGRAGDRSDGGSGSIRLRSASCNTARPHVARDDATVLRRGDPSRHANGASARRQPRSFPKSGQTRQDEVARGDLDHEVACDERRIERRAHQATMVGRSQVDAEVKAASGDVDAELRRIVGVGDAGDRPRASAPCVAAPVAASESPAGGAAGVSPLHAVTMAKPTEHVTDRAPVGA
jgi:hypothetical protein